MPSKRKAVPTAAAPKCRTRICCSHYHPGDDESQAPLLNSTPFRAFADVVTSALKACQKDFAWQLTQCVRNGRNGGARTRRTGHGEGTLGTGQVQQAGIMRGGIGFTVAKAMEMRRSVCKEEFSP